MSNKWSDWTDDYREAVETDRDDLLEQGVALARERRAAMLELIQSDPQAALAAAIPRAEREQLPKEIQEQLETIISARAPLEVVQTCFHPDEPDKCTHDHEVYRSTFIDGRAYLVHVHGSRLNDLSIPHSSLHGIAIDGHIAVSESRIRVLDTTEAQLAGVFLPTPDAIAVEANGEVTVLASTDELAEFEAAILEGEDNPTYIASDANDGVSTVTNRPNQAHATGTKKMLVILVDFSDLPGRPLNRSASNAPLTEVAVEALINGPNGVRQFFQDSSFGKTDLLLTPPDANGDSPDITEVLRAPRTASYYSITGGSSLLQTEAIAAAATAGYATTSYDRICVVHTNLSNYDGGTEFNGWAGKAGVGGTRSIYNGWWDFRVVAHELGHNWGLWHANLWKVTDGDPGSLAGTSEAYGNSYDTMGAASGSPLKHFSPWSKTLMWWIPDAAVPAATTSGTYRVHRFDHKDADLTKPRALKIVRNSTRDYWIGYRRTDPTSSLYNGAYVLWGYNSGRTEPDLLDMNTPGSNLGDAALNMNQTYTDSSGAIEFTPVAQGGSGGDEWIDIQVVFHQPRVSFASSSYTVNQDAGSVTLTVNRTQSSLGSISVNYATSPGTATAPADYTTTSGTLSWADGDTTPKTFQVPIVDGPAGESEETFTVALSSPLGGMIGDTSTTTVTITAIVNEAPVVSVGADQFVSLVGTYWSPIELTPQLWLDAEDPSTITLNGGTVSQWADKSGNNRHATQATTTLQPAYVPDGLNGKRILTFDGSDDFFAVNLNFLAGTGTAHSAFIVTKPTVYSNIYGAANGGASSNSLHVGFTSSTNYRINYWGNDYVPSISSNFAKGAANLVNFTWIPGTGKQIFANGKSEGSTTTVGNIGTMSGGGRIGHTTTETHSPFGGDIAEMIFLTGTVDPVDREITEGYLAHKWGLTNRLATDHPYKTNNPNDAQVTIDLNGSASDADGHPLTYAWSYVSGPGPVTFSDPNALNTTATFTASGIYTLRLSVSDIYTTVAKDVVITVDPPISGNTVTYNGNGSTGGSVPVDATGYNDQDTVTVLGNTGSLTRSGYVFDGWNTAADGSGTSYSAGNTFPITADTTLYAQWTPSTYTVTFHANGGNTPSPTSKSVTYDATYGTLASVARPGYLFNGWFTAASGGTEITAATPVAITDNQTLYAQWALVPVAVVADKSTVSVPEGGTATFQVKLSAQPAANVTVTVARSSGDSNISVQSGSSLTFTTANWNTYQTVTLAAANDADADNGTATITCTPSNPAYIAADVTATEADKDTTLTIASAGNGTTTPSGSLIVAKSTATGIEATPATGHHFVNWTVTSGAATFADANAATTTVSITAPATIQANFAPDTYLITYNGNGNDGGSAPADQDKLHDIELTLAANIGNLAKTGFSFVGWNTADDGSGTDFPAEGAYTANAPLTLYAKWSSVADGTWLPTLAGPFDWGDPANWVDGTIASGAGYTAYFTPNLTENQTVNLEEDRTIGNITFTDSTTASHDLTISGANTLTLANTTATPAINVTESGRTLTLATPITGTHGLTKSGSGALTLAGNNSTRSGTTTLSAGTLNLNSASALGTGAFTLGNNTSIDNTSGAPVTLSTNNAITANSFSFGGTHDLNLGTGGVLIGYGDRSITLNGTGSTLSISGELSLYRANSSQGMKLTVNGAGNTLLLGSLGIGAGSTNITIQGSADVTVSGATTETINADKALIKNGTGTLTLNGTYTSDSFTRVNGGTLLINGDASAATGAFTVNATGANGTLGGAGTIGADTTIAEGGGLTFHLSTAAASHDKLELTTGKSLTFSGASVLTITGTPDAAPGEYVLLTAPGGIAGEAPATLNLPSGWAATVSKIGNDLVLDLTSTGGGSTYTVTFDANGGETPVPTSKQVTFASAYGTLASTTRTGYTLNGWFTAASGGTEVTEATSVAISADHTLYAQWTFVPVAVITDLASVNVPEGSTATFQVKLSAQPAENVTVTVARSSGDSDITVQSGSSLSFTTANWDTYQTVTLAAANDADADNGSATITCTPSNPAYTTANVTATEADKDTTLTIASAGNGTTTPSGSLIVVKSAATGIAATPATGHHFVNWTLTSGSATFANANAASTTVSITAPATIQANFAPDTYLVTYLGNGNDGGSAPADQDKLHDAPLTLRANTGNLVKTGFSFVGWNTADDGSGTDFPAEGTYTTNAPLTLYAKWSSAADGTWLPTLAGPYNWGDPANWTGGTIASGAGHTASFTPGLTENQTVNLEAARTIGNITFTDSTIASNNLTISGTSTLTLTNTAATPVIDVTQANRTLTIASPVAGSNGLRKNGPGILALTGTGNVYTGVTTVNAGILSVASLANGGSDSSIGASSSAATNLVLEPGTTLRYTGAGGSTNRSFTINGTAAAHAATLDASGTDAIQFTGSTAPALGTTNQTRTLTLTGTHTGENILAANLANNGTGQLTINKTGAGTWVLTGTNTNQTTDYNTSSFTNSGGGLLILRGAAAIQNAGVLKAMGTATCRVESDTSFTTTTSGLQSYGTFNFQADRQTPGNGDGLIFTFDNQNALSSEMEGNTTLNFSAGPNVTSGTPTIDITRAGGAFRTRNPSDNTTHTINADGVNVRFNGYYDARNDRNRTVILGGTSTGNEVYGLINNSGTGVAYTVIKNGTGTWTFSANNGYTGTTSVNAGKLLINGDQSTASGNVSVAADAFLGGTGTIGGNTTIDANGGLAFHLSTPATSHDKLELAATKSLTFSGASVLTITGTPDAVPGEYVLLTAPGGISGVAPTTLNLPADWVATVSKIGNDLVLDLTSTGMTAYDTWAAANGLTGESNTAPEEDHDGDGLTNLQEFAFGMNPTTSVRSPLSYTPDGSTAGGTPVLENTGTSSLPNYRAVFVRRKDHETAGLIYQVQFSANLTHWEPVLTAPTVLTGENQAPVETVAVPYPSSVPLIEGGPSSAAPKFFRVGVNMQ